MKKFMPLLFTVLLVGGVVYYFNSKKSQVASQNLPNLASASPTPIVSDNTEIANVSEITNNYYKNYDSCVKTPPKEAAGRVSIYCQENTGLTTSAFAANLDKGGTAKAGADPIFCAQDIPESVNVDQIAQITSNKATVFVNEKFGSGVIGIKVDLLKENWEWKIDNIICPLP